MSGLAWVISIGVWGLLGWEGVVQHRQIRSLAQASGARIRELEDRVDALESELSDAQRVLRIHS